MAQDERVARLVAWQRARAAAAARSLNLRITFVRTAP